jgi:hypothetical protein
MGLKTYPSPETIKIWDKEDIRVRKAGFLGAAVALVGVIGAIGSLIYEAKTRPEKPAIVRNAEAARDAKERLSVICEQENADANLRQAYNSVSNYASQYEKDVGDYNRMVSRRKANGFLGFMGLSSLGSIFAWLTYRGLKRRANKLATQERTKHTEG